MIRLGVCGWPVAHSRSPQMHNAALAVLGLHDWRYQLLPLPPQLFAETVRALPELGFRGVNVTIPHKEAALALADDATETAQRDRRREHADVRERPDPRRQHRRRRLPERAARVGLRPHRARARRRRLGARDPLRAPAGAARARCASGTAHPTAREALAAEFGAVVSAEPAEIVVNCTSIGLSNPDETFKALPLQADEMGAGRLVVDLVYRHGGTLLLNVAKANGAEVVDGLEILVAQGAASLERWTGRTAPDQAMREAVADIAR